MKENRKFVTVVTVRILIQKMDRRENIVPDNDRFTCGNIKLEKVELNRFINLKPIQYIIFFGCLFCILIKTFYCIW
jgi:hypothetical protein